MSVNRKNTMRECGHCGVLKKLVGFATFVFEAWAAKKEWTR